MEREHTVTCPREQGVCTVNHKQDAIYKKGQ